MPTRTYVKNFCKTVKKNRFLQATGVANEFLKVFSEEENLFMSSPVLVTIKMPGVL